MGVSAVLTSNAAPSYSRTLEGVRNARVGARVSRNRRGRKYSQYFPRKGRFAWQIRKLFRFWKNFSSTGGDWGRVRARGNSTLRACDCPRAGDGGAAGCGLHADVFSMDGVFMEGSADEDEEMQYDDDDDMMGQQGEGEGIDDEGGGEEAGEGGGAGDSGAEESREELTPAEQVRAPPPYRPRAHLG